MKSNLGREFVLLVPAFASSSGLLYNYVPVLATCVPPIIDEALFFSKKKSITGISGLGFGDRCQDKDWDCQSELGPIRVEAAC